MSDYGTDFWLSYSAAAACESALADAGISLRVTTRVSEILESVERIGKPYLTPWLDPMQNDFNETNFFWIIAEKAGDPVLVGGARLDDVGRDPGDFLARLFARTYGASAVASISSELSCQLAGRVCYFGDLYSRSGVGLSRKNRRMYLVVAHFMAFAHFRADITYSFMRARDVHRGSADVNGFDRRVFQAVTWAEMPSERAIDEVAVLRFAKQNRQYFQSAMQELGLYEEELSAPRDYSQQASQA